ncbi:MAG TPA: type VI secretion system baseplate subunit TssF [Telluria sp.]|nr:type VI secretion system baseplate subunit TssF [Telluria sp.]
MENLLPYFERELGFLKRSSREFAERFPKLASSLQLLAEDGNDPHIERLIQASALLNARIAKRLDDDYPEFTEALLGVLYPHFLRALPACSIAHFDSAASPAGALPAATCIARGSELTSRAGSGVPCKFRTTYDVTLAPLVLAEARFHPIIEAPPSVRLPVGVTSSISIVLESRSATAGVGQLGVPSLRVFADGDASFCAALLDCLFMRVECAYLELAGGGPWQPLDAAPIAMAGFAEGDALIPCKASEHAAYRLLTEYFSFPEKFNFFDIDVAALATMLPETARSVTLHFAVSGLGSDSNMARILKPLSAKNLLLGCTPIINLFKQSAAPIRLTQTATQYDLVPSSKQAEAYEVYSIDSVQVLRSANGRSGTTEVRPYYSLRHGEGDGKRHHYWFSRRDEEQASISPGYETKIGFVDIDFAPAGETGVASIETTCSNRDLPGMLTYGAPAGDLSAEGGTRGIPIRMLRKPTAPQRFGAGNGMHWRLVSQLALNHRSLASIEAFTEMLALYNLPQSMTSQRQIAGVVGLAGEPATAWIRNRHGASLVHGMEIRMTLDETAFAGSGMHAFAQVVNHFFGLYVHINSFTQLVILSKQTGKELLRCPPRNGKLTLV